MALTGFEPPKSKKLNEIATNLKIVQNLSHEKTRSGERVLSI